MKFFCPLTKICTATPEKMREHMEGELYKQFVAKDTGMQTNQRTFWDRRARVCVFGLFFSLVHLLKLDDKSLFRDIRRGGRGSSQSTSPKIARVWVAHTVFNQASKTIAEGRIYMNLLKTNGWNPTIGGS